MPPPPIPIRRPLPITVPSSSPSPSWTTPHITPATPPHTGQPLRTISSSQPSQSSPKGVKTPLLERDMSQRGSMNSIRHEISLDNLNEDEPLIETQERKSHWSCSCLTRLHTHLFAPRPHHDRTLHYHHGHFHVTPEVKYPRNIVVNQKYHVITFLPVFLFEQFRFFFNLYFLLVALTQFIPVLQVGFLFTYVAPLVFVLSVTMIKEAYDDIQRWRRDREANSQIYERVTAHGTERIPSSEIKIGDFLRLHTNQRVPADLLLLRTSDKQGSIFIRTDQLDGETDWKLRLAVTACQKLPNDDALFSMNARIDVEAPKKAIYEFAATFVQEDVQEDAHDGNQHVESLSLENTLWSNTVVASGTIIGVVIYTGTETRSVMNAATPVSKIGLIDHELNTLSKILFGLTLGLALVMTGLKGFEGLWWIYLFRFILLFSSIIPISMRVNLDMGKTLYSVWMMRDKSIPDTVVRNSTIPEELGRITYLFSDKTGTLTRNEMTFKVLQMMPPVTFNRDTTGLLSRYLAESYTTPSHPPPPSDDHKHTPISLHIDDDDDDEHTLFHHRKSTSTSPSSQHGLLRTRRVTDVDDEDMMPNELIRQTSTSSLHDRIRDAEAKLESEMSHLSHQHVVSMVRRITTGIALCHNVTPVKEENGEIAYQAASPDEVALVKFTESVGLRLSERTQHEMSLITPTGDVESYDILNIFPFTSETKRMGIIVRERASGEIRFYLKGAESIMKSKMQPSDWLEEEVDNLARVGLRTLVIACKILSEEEYNDFFRRYNAAKAVIKNRDSQVLAVVKTLEKNLSLLGLTGVEDRLQHGVCSTLELLRNAGIRIWMLTGDKAETAICIGISARLIDKGQHVFTLIVANKRDAARQLDVFSTKVNTCLVIDGPSLAICLEHFQREFLELSCQAPSVICCRCSPTQKAQIVTLMKGFTGKRTAAIGDGGNDVSMILAADIGIGIVGKEGKQASLAADFSITQFSFINRLILWHGRNSYYRSARLSQFVIHRGLIISIIQAVFSALFFYVAIAIYNGWLMVGYATFYTMLPVFSLVLDEDVDEQQVFVYPELYKDLQKGRPMSYKTFFLWVLKSVYQGGVIMVMSIVLFENNFLNIVSITFTSLILSELVNVALEIHTWHYLMIASELISVAIYFASIFILKTYFDITFIFTWNFAWKVAVITSISCLPPAMLRCIYRWKFPPAHSKIRQ